MSQNLRLHVAYKWIWQTYVNKLNILADKEGLHISFQNTTQHLVNNFPPLLKVVIGV